MLPRAFLLACLLPLVLSAGCRNKDDTGDSATVVDADLDGFPADEDCDDSDAAVNPDAAETPYDGLDNDCDPTTPDDDLDGDGFALADDCDDSNAAVNPDAVEACNGVDDDCSGEADDAVGDTWYLDADGDGHGDPEASEQSCDGDEGLVADATDCDDDRDDVYPSAPEICDDADQDCDTLVDEGVQSTFFTDADGDGYGDPETGADACAPASDQVTDDSDCDDADSSVNPAASELCDGVDNDCDAAVDDDDDDVADATTWHRDDDGDGHGDPGETLEACTQPSGTSSSNGDCDDGDPSVFPGAEELCNRSDDDCDRTVDEDATDASVWYADLDGDGHGDPASSTVACEAGATSVADDTDCDDTDATVSPVATELCDGVDNDCDFDTDESGAADATTWYADTDADGFGDPDSATTACEAPTDHVADLTDCDDSDAAVNAYADEDCNDTDDDCDLSIDEGLTEATWYLDGDGDGYGTPDTTTEACEAPSGYVDSDTDCDDTDASVFPEPGGCAQGASCLAILEGGESVGDGPYTIDPDGAGSGVDPFDVTCDMTTDGGGWTSVDYADDLAFGTQFSGGDTYTWLSSDFTFLISDDQIAALQALSTEGRQTYVGLCEHVIHYFYDDGGNHDYSFGFRFFDGTETPYGSSSYSPYDITVPVDGCAQNGGEGGDPSLATEFDFVSPLVPLVNVIARDAGDSAEYYGSPLTENPAWLR